MLHRRSRIAFLMLALLCVAALALTAAAQRKQQRAKGPRAVALVQWIGSGPPRVIPIAILVDGRFYDASIYKASPVPMALEPGTVYEVEESGESVGMVTLTEAKETQQGAWFADARYQTNAQLAAARAPRKAEKPVLSEPDSGPPKLRRGPVKDTSSEPAPASTSAPPSSAPRGPDEPPVLRKPANETQPPAAEGGAKSSSAGEDARATSQAAPATAPEDRDRPVLRRGRPTAEQADSLPDEVSAPAPGAKKPGATAATAKPAVPRRVLAAISDAGGPEPHSYKFGWTPQEQQKLTAAVQALAASALGDYARTHPGAIPGKLEDVQARAFDVDYNNSPYVVLTARAGEVASTPVRRAGARVSGAQAASAQAVGGITFWVTLVARQDFNGDLIKLMTSVTDSKHLDAFPRLELIDAIDVDGDGRGEMIFREISDVDRNYVIYRVTPDNLRELFNTAEQ